MRVHGVHTPLSNTENTKQCIFSDKSRTKVNLLLKNKQNSRQEVTYMSIVHVSINAITTIRTIHKLQCRTSTSRSEQNW